MRSLYTLVLLFFSLPIVKAQVMMPEVPLESNPVLQRIEKQRQLVEQSKLERYFGPETATARTVSGDCEDDGVYESGETVYILSGESLEICLDTTGFVTFNNLSIDGNFGTTSTFENCITYTSDIGIELGLGDTMRVELCLPDETCFIREFPVVVKRENETFVETPVTMGTETELMLCVDPANYILPTEIAGSSILDCHSTSLANALNGISKDSCLLLESKRFAGMDTVCLEISNEFCISDTYKFPFQVIGDTLSLPFLDDFSYDGPFPGSLWLDKEAFVNNTWGYRPPSVGFATMDGLDETGTPYGGGYGRADFLTSNYIDLSPYNANSNVFLSCYVQPKGYGFHPNEGDSLVVEFKKSNGEWVQIHAFQGISGFVDVDSLPPFDNYFTFNIIASVYLYKGFQFRFVNYAQRTGIRDIWHIDYVLLNANQIPDGTFEDIAFTNVPNDLLKRYSSVPWRHYDDNSMFIDSLDIELYSQFENTETANPSGFKIRELETNTEIADIPVLLLTDAVTGNVNQRNVPSQEHRFYTNPINEDEIAGLPSFSEEKLVFELEYYFTANAQNPGFFPEVERNDTVRTRTIFDNYFAYDDGTAETSMFTGLAPGEAVASGFTALEDDSLRAVQIHFPHYNNQDNARFHLRVHIGELGNVVYEKLSMKPFFADSVLDTLQGFTTFRLSDDADIPSPVAIPAGEFFIELEQANTITPTRVGLDKNSPEAKENQYLKIFGNWVGLGNNGAMMLRPVVGDFTPPNTSVDEVMDHALDFSVYPNPSSGLINLKLEDSNINNLEVRIFNNLGQLVLQKQLWGSQLDLGHLENGNYLLQIINKKTNQYRTQKIILFKN